MASPLFIWLGAGRARRRHVAQRGQLLDQAARSGLPVPPGAILLDELLRTFIDKGLVENQGDRLLIPDPELFYNTLFYSVRLPPFKRPVLVLPACDAVPAALSNRDPIDFGDNIATAAALSAVWTDISRAPIVRADVIVIEQVAANHAGVALTNDTADEVSLTLGEAPDFPAGLPRLSGWSRPDPALPSFSRRLQMLLRGARRTFGPGRWQIEWADDGQICYLTDIAVAPQA
ncbi:MAG TPA: hypothetical protein PK205_10535 [Promineifilum sp.]|nr:hypothetical protein [Promineifilum sp.]HRO25067.1 hypothetical protein [Promineifilum sp.]HRQ13729.1 hypothetical protein [Promineifilum sp.]